MASSYVEMRNGGYYVTGTRVSLDTLVYPYNDGASPEGIQDELPSLTLEQIHGALAFYLANKQRVDENIAEGKREVHGTVPSLEASNPELSARLQRARQERGVSRGLDQAQSREGQPMRQFLEDLAKEHGISLK